MQNFLLPTFVLLLFLQFGNEINAQASVILETQEQVDAFGATNPTIVSQLQIFGEDITDLRPLASLTRVEGFFSVSYTTNLTSLQGLNNIKFVQFLWVKNNAKLINLEGLNGLESGGFYEIEENVSLESLDGLNNLTALEYIKIASNPKLSDCASVCNLPLTTGKDIYGNTLECTNRAVFENYCTPNMGNITLSTQQEVDDFKTTYNNLQIIPGYLRLFDAPLTSDPIINLDGLDEVSSIGSGLIIQHTKELTNLDGLSSLLDSGYNVNISDNAKLQHINGLANVGRTSLNLIIRNNLLLTDLKGFDQVTAVGFLEISLNPILVNFEVFSNLQEAINIVIKNNIALDSIAFPELISLTEDFLISENPALLSLDGLNKLSEMRNLSIYNTNNLNSLLGLQNLKTVRGVYITSTGITTINGLQNLNSVDRISFSDNVNLIAISGLDKLFDVSSITINNNAQLTTINFQNIETLSQLEIDGNQLLETISLGNITSLDVLLFFNNNKMNDLRAFQNITSIVYSLNLFSNQGLTTLEGLENLESVGFAVGISGNPALENYCALQKLVATDTDVMVDVADNAYNPTKEEIIDNHTCQSPTLGVDEIVIPKSKISVYPNPVTELLKIYITSEKSSYELFTINGQMARRGFLEKGENEIQVLDLEKGVYFINLQQAGKSSKTYKIIMN